MDSHIPLLWCKIFVPEGTAAGNWGRYVLKRNFETEENISDKQKCVISVAEEFALLDALDLKRLTVTDKKTNETSKVYFNTDLVVNVKD